jgi:peptidoglycan/xylan/chitin deacetylase (PgdA/CDA1 family)
MYHRINKLLPTLPEMTRRLTVEPAMFARQMAWLDAHGYHAITQAQLYEALTNRRRLPARPVLITFDDGYRDVYEHAVPILARLDMPATAYVITGRISGPDPSFLTWRMLRSMERLGVEIGSHTVTHADLPSLSDARAFGELVHSRRALERRLGHPVRWLAYPYGHNASRIVRLARRAGYLLAVTTEPGSEQPADDPLRLHRCGIIDTTGVAGLAACVR